MQVEVDITVRCAKCGEALRCGTDGMPQRSLVVVNPCEFCLRSQAVREANAEIQPRRLAERICECRGDPEGGHIAADRILCEALDALGYQAAVEQFRKLSKWYS